MKALTIPFLAVIMMVSAACKKKSEEDSSAPASPMSEETDAREEKAKPFDLPDTAGQENSDSESSGVITLEPPRNKNYLSLSKNLLDKEFLLQVNITYQSPAPEFNGLKSRIIVFSRQNNDVLMLEVLRGKQVQASGASNAVLARIPVVSESDADLELDFNAGVSRLFLMGDTYASDFAGKQYDAEANWKSVSFADSYMKAITYNKELESFSIHQAGRLSFFDQSFGGQADFPVDVIYYLQTYQPDPEYVPINYYNKKYVGFFEVTPQVRKGGGEDLVLSARFNLRGDRKVKYFLSKNTPAEYQEAIKRGVLYWNSVFGREVLEVAVYDKESHEVTSADNMIHWIEWQNAPYAYADMRSDPLTGEIRNVQIFLTSAFAVNNKRQARILQNSLRGFQAPAITLDQSLLDAVKGKDNTEMLPIQKSFFSQWQSINQSAFGNESGKLVGLKGFETADLCNLKVTRSQLSDLQGILSSPEDIESRTKKLSEDILTTVVAHEVGHTLGLRHNFAGSLSADFSYEEHENLVKEYLISDKIPEKSFGNTVMDYYQFSDMAMTGARIRGGKSALSYDKKAIGVLYNSQPLDVGDKVLFCTDSHRAEFVDCNVFDSGPDLISYYKWQEAKQLENLPSLVLELFIRAVFPPEGYEKIPLRDVELSPDYFAMNILSGRYGLLNSLESKSKYIRVRGLYSVINDLNEKKVRDEEKNYLNNAVSSDLLKESLKDFEDGLGEELLKKFEENLSENYKEFMYKDGKVSFSPEDLKLVRLRAGEFFTALPESLMRWDLILCSVPRDLMDLEALNVTFPEILGGKVFSAITKTTEESMKAQYTESKAEILLKTFKFSFPLRVFSAMSFSNQTMEQNALWGAKDLEQQGKAIYKVLNDMAFGQSNAHTGQGLQILRTEYKNWTAENNPTLQRRIQNWIYENQKLLSLLKSQVPLY